jgi:uncharacterized membrane protein (DUF106 family)
MLLYAMVGFAVASIFGTRWLLGTLKPKPNEAKLEMKKTINELKQQAEELNSPSTYAAYSKLNRQIQNMEARYSEMQDVQGHTDLYWVIVCMPYASALLFIGQTYDLNVYGEDVYWPIHNFIGKQENKVFHLSLSVWYAVCLIVIKFLVS